MNKRRPRTGQHRHNLTRRKHINQPADDKIDNAFTHRKNRKANRTMKTSLTWSPEADTGPDE